MAFSFSKELFTTLCLLDAGFIVLFEEPHPTFWQRVKAAINGEDKT